MHCPVLTVRRGCDRFIGAADPKLALVRGDRKGVETRITSQPCGCLGVGRCQKDRETKDEYGSTGAHSFAILAVEYKLVTISRLVLTYPDQLWIRSLHSGLRLLRRLIWEPIDSSLPQPVLLCDPGVEFLLRCRALQEIFDHVVLFESWK